MKRDVLLNVYFINDRDELDCKTLEMHNYDDNLTFDELKEKLGGEHTPGITGVTVLDYGECLHHYV